MITDHVFEPGPLGDLVICIYLYGNPPRNPCGRFGEEHGRIEHEHAPAEEETAGA